MKKIVGLVGAVAIALLAMSLVYDNGGQKANAPLKPKAKVFAKKGGPGIEFSKISFEKAKKEARKSGKLVFIDAYTNWCGPCKRMAATSFKDKAVGDYFNKHFVNLKVEMEKDPDGKEIARLYRVRAYPTLIIVDPSGKVVKQTIGMKSKDQLMAFAKSAR